MLIITVLGYTILSETPGVQAMFYLLHWEGSSELSTLRTVPWATFSWLLNICIDPISLTRTKISPVTV